ncbi:hypothetical protein BSLG_006047 [Batrachochytrium salamandrivorans]|nr:hypothetical protein BSLG_006047 [Batrachochytrium salamandrivorans]
MLGYMRFGCLSDLLCCKCCCFSARNGNKSGSLIPLSAQKASNDSSKNNPEKSRKGYRTYHGGANKTTAMNGQLSATTTKTSLKDANLSVTTPDPVYTAFALPLHTNNKDTKGPAALPPNYQKPCDLLDLQLQPISLEQQLHPAYENQKIVPQQTMEQTSYDNQSFQQKSINIPFTPASAVSYSHIQHQPVIPSEIGPVMSDQFNPPSAPGFFAFWDKYGWFHQGYTDKYGTIHGGIFDDEGRFHFGYIGAQEPVEVELDMMARSEHTDESYDGQTLVSSSNSKRELPMTPRDLDDHVFQTVSRFNTTAGQYGGNYLTLKVELDQSDANRVFEDDIPHSATIANATHMPTESEPSILKQSSQQQHKMMSSAITESRDAIIDSNTVLNQQPPLLPSQNNTFVPKNHLKSQTHLDIMIVRDFAFAATDARFNGKSSAASTDTKSKKNDALRQSNTADNESMSHGQDAMPLSRRTRSSGRHTVYRLKVHRMHAVFPFVKATEYEMSMESGDELIIISKHAGDVKPHTDDECDETKDSNKKVISGRWTSIDELEDVDTLLGARSSSTSTTPSKYLTRENMTITYSPAVDELSPKYRILDYNQLGAGWLTGLKLRVYGKWEDPTPAIESRKLSSPSNYVELDLFLETCEKLHNIDIQPFRFHIL